MTAPDHMAQVAAMRQLSGRNEPVHDRAAITVRAIDALAASTRSWSALSPRVAAVSAAIVQCDAIGRSLRELRDAANLELSRGGGE